MCFVCISEQTAIISLYNINWLVCITETECVYCAVRTGYLSINKLILSLSRVNNEYLTSDAVRGLMGGRPAFQIDRNVAFEGQ